VAGRDPEAQDIRAGLLDDRLRLDGVTERFRHLAAVLVLGEAVSQHDVVRRAAARTAALQQRGMEPAAVLVASFQIHHSVIAAVGFALDPSKTGEVLGDFQHEAWVEPESNQTSRMSSTFCQSSLPRGPRKRSRAPSAYQASAPSCSKASAMRLLISSSC